MQANVLIDSTHYTLKATSPFLQDFSTDIKIWTVTEWNTKLLCSPLLGFKSRQI